MPTVQVKPTSSELLQHVADSLGKARKVVIITGAGISTNSGIPDFRSENGLYSLIQAQFERAEANHIKDTDGQTADFPLSGRPAKRRRISQPAEDSTDPARLTEPTQASDGYWEQDRTKQLVKSSDAGIRENVLEQAEAPVRPEPSLQRLTRSQSGLRPSLPRNVTRSSTQSASHESLFSVSAQLSSASSPVASPESDGSAACSVERPIDNQTRNATPRASSSTTFSSSPLSSPPPILFDPYDNTNSCTDGSSQGTNETSDTSDSEDTQNSLDIFSSQTCNSSLRNMKGRDLFDSNIWADPLKTSVFYRFATTLRQKVKEVEPTATHRFIAQLRDVGKLARVYTQNIDEIEKKIGLSTDLKNGAGNKRRKSAKQQLVDPEKDSKDSKESCEPTRCEDDLSSADAVQASQSSEASGRGNARSVLGQDRGVECVFLHGSLHALRCFVCGKLCDWDEDGRESCTMLGEQPECPHCAGATAARQERGKRALGVGKLRPDIVLYGEEHPQSDLISPIVQHDLSAGPDLLLILGTSLRVHGLKVMVKEFAKAVHNKGGKVVFINLTKPSESAWGDMIDYWIEWDCDAWVDDLKNRKPHLWLSPDEILEFEKQKREALAEKKRENISKKRESLVEKRRHTIGVVKSRPPPKNPSSMRNDYQCGAYVVWEIFQTLAKIGDRPFDNLGYDPPHLPPPAAPPPASSRPMPVLPGPGSTVPEPRRAAKTKKARKSAPATVPASTKSDTMSKPPVKAKFATHSKSRNQYTKAAQELARTGKPPTPVRLAELNRVAMPQEKVVTLPYEAPSSITAAVKLHPRQRKPKILDDMPIGRAAPTAKKLPAPLPQDTRESVPAQSRLAISTTCGTFSKGPILPPFHPGWERSPPAKITPLEPNLNISPRSPLADLPPVMQPQVFTIPQATHPMFFSDPLIKLPYETTNYRKPLKEADTAYEKAPSPSDQLRWELAQQEALEGAQALEGLRHAR
ncbi:DHS-like NAD/FAD-binding domain-containing protein [Hypoxylon cercidicola]|nr:DHS-like NAD/FAD-binding domain-containing protein [Hypoxylon cercidicola]